MRGRRQAPAHHFASAKATLIAVLEALVSSTITKSPLALGDAMLTYVTRTSESYAGRVGEIDIYSKLRPDLGKMTKLFLACLPDQGTGWPDL